MPDLHIETFVSPPLATNCFLVVDENAREAIAVDTSCVGDEMLARCREKKWDLKAIVLTHAHIDHIHDAATMAEKSGAPIWAHPLTIPGAKDPNISGAAMLEMRLDPFDVALELNQDDEISIGEHTMRILHTPGHSAGSICLLGKTDCIVGDLLFREGVGRWDLLEGDHDTLAESVCEFARQVADNITIHPGHGPITTMAYLRENNSLVQSWLKKQ